MSEISDRLRAISRLQPPGIRTIDRHNKYDHESRAPDTRSTASNNRGGHPWRKAIPRRVAKRVA